MTIPEKLQALRAVMKANGIDIYVVPTDDFHQSEYVGEHFKARTVHYRVLRISRNSRDHTRQKQDSGQTDVTSSRQASTVEGDNCRTL